MKPSGDILWQKSFGAVVGYCFNRGYVLSKGNYAAIPIDNKSFLLNLSANQTFTISKKQHITCNVIASNTIPFTVVKAAGPFNFTLSATDIFKTNKDVYLVHADDTEFQNVKNRITTT